MGKFEKGKPRHPNAGRRKGTPNKNSLSLLQKCVDRGIDVFDEMLSIALTTTDPEPRFRMFSQISEYLYPKRKALEIDAELDLGLAQRAREVSEMTKEDQIKLLESELKRLKELP